MSNIAEITTPFGNASLTADGWIGNNADLAAILNLQLHLPLERHYPDRSFGYATEAAKLVNGSVTYIRPFEGYHHGVETTKMVTLKGGPGSGFTSEAGHQGIPGQVGGSQHGDGSKSENFKKWFGNSKVVNEDGSPKVVYHGTTADFTSFNPGKPNKKMELGFGIHFAEDAEFAGKHYASDNTKGQDKPLQGGKIIPVYLSIQNMLDADKVYGPDTPEYKLAQKIAIRRALPMDGVYLQRILDMSTPDRVERLIREAGYDGIKYKAEITSGLVGYPGHWSRVISDSSTSYVVFEPTQIKSSMSNTGDYDLTNPDVTKEANVKATIKVKKDVLQSGEYPRPQRVQDSGAQPPLLTRNVYNYLIYDGPKHITIFESNRLPKGTIAVARGSAVYLNSKAVADKPISYTAAMCWMAAVKTQQNQKDPMKVRELDAIQKTLLWIKKRQISEQQPDNVKGLKMAANELEKYRDYINKNVGGDVPSSMCGV